MNTPSRGFLVDEYESRLMRAQEALTGAELDGLFVTMPANVRYFSGFDTQFWESPTRPWFIVVPRVGDIIAVIPEIGKSGMEETWVDDIRTWFSPVPEDDGVSLLSEALSSLKRRYGRIGAELGKETALRMPALDLEKLRASLPASDIVDGTPVIRELRSIKSEAEVGHIRHICQVVSDAFEVFAQKLRVGDTEREACQKFRSDLISRGVDHSPYLIGVSGRGGYNNIIMGPTDRRIEEGDVLIVDTGSVFDGYYCDFDRNYAFGEPSNDVKRAHGIVWKATQTGIDTVRPGMTTTELWRAMMSVLEDGGSIGNNVGRLGHGLGLQMTEPPSTMNGDDTVIRAGMVLTIEPGMLFAPSKMIVHEENIVVTDDGVELLTRRAPVEMPIVQ